MIEKNILNGVSYGMQQWIYNNTFKRYLNSLLEYILDFTYWCWTQWNNIQPHWMV